jgi:sec-independent protein translocase protein TatC
VARLKPVSYEDRLTLVEHLTELRGRVVVSALAFGAAFALCFWQSHEIIEVLNDPLGNRPLVTLSPTEPFLTTIKVSAYAALLIALPVLLFQAYAFLLPAFSPTERRVALPLLLMVPVLFVAGAAFAYFVILPPAIAFLLGFNADEFTVQLRASEYYGFALMLLIALGVCFQIPVGILAATRLGITTPERLGRNRRYAVLVIAVVAMVATPSQDPATMLLTMAPLLVLFELSILLAKAFGRPSPEARERLASAEGS